MIGFHTIDHMSGQNMELNSMVPINCNLLRMCIVVCMIFCLFFNSTIDYNTARYFFDIPLFVKSRTAFEMR